VTYQLCTSRDFERQRRLTHIFLYVEQWQLRVLPKGECQIIVSTCILSLPKHLLEIAHEIACQHKCAGKAIFDGVELNVVLAIEVLDFRQAALSGFGDIDEGGEDEVRLWKELGSDIDDVAALGDFSGGRTRLPEVGDKEDRVAPL
jgi:hypothetical protein